MNPAEGFTQFGLNGLIIGSLFAFIYFLVKLHSSERKEWLTAYNEVSKMSDNRQAETNALLNRIIERRLLNRTDERL